MYQIIIEFYSGDSLVSDSVKQSLIDTLPNNFLLYILFGLLLIYFIFILFYFIITVAKKNPVKLFNKYKEIRAQVEKVDDLYTNKKLSYAEYVSLQFDAAKEYERVTSILVKYPEYKSKIASYNLIASTSKDIVDNVSKQKQSLAVSRDNQKQIDALYKILLPKAKYYTEDEIMLALRDESFSKEIACNVINKIKETGIVFGSQVQVKTNRVVEFVNTLFASKTKNIDIDEELVERNKQRIETERKTSETTKNKQSTEKNQLSKPTSVLKPKGEIIDIKEIVSSSKDKSNSQLQPTIDFYKIEERRSISKKQKGGFIAALKVLLFGVPKEQKIHSVDEINDIFKDIEQAIKEKRNN